MDKRLEKRISTIGAFTYALVAHDWSHLSYGKHKSKNDTYKTIKNSVGYKLQTSLLLSDNHGGFDGLCHFLAHSKRKRTGSK